MFFLNYIIYTVLQCDLLPLRPHGWGGPGPRLEPGPGGPESGTTTPPQNSTISHLHITKKKQQGNIRFKKEFSFNKINAIT